MPLIKEERLEDGIVILTLNQAERLNALGEDTAAAFRATVESLSLDCSLRAVVLTGAGRAFSAGGHIEMLVEKSKRESAQVRAEMLEFYNSFLCLHTLSVPVLAAINGAAIGAGLGIASACDMRFAASDIPLAANFIQLGLHPGMGASHLLARLVGQTRAQDWLLSGRRFKSEEALEAGLLHAVYPAEELMEQVLAHARVLAALAPEALAQTLMTLRAEPAELQRALAREATCQAENFATLECRECILSLSEKMGLGRS